MAAPGDKRPPARTRQWYELRTMRLRSGQPKAVNAFLSEAALPAWRRHGVGPVGVFEMVIGPEMPALVVLLTHESPAPLATLPGQLAADAAFQHAAAGYLGAAAGQPPFMRVDSALLQAFETMPHLEAPAAGGDRAARVFELRTYESPTEAAHLKKMEMFSRMGETEIFRRVGLHPVFFAQTVIGPRLPSFSYMLTFADMAAREKAWAAFRADPEWQKLRATAGYTDVDTVSNISDVLLRPAAYSQI
jgi:NIPSNAP protein